MVSECFAPVRGSAIRVTGLTSRGAVPSSVEYVTSKSVSKIQVSEVVESGGTEVVKNPQDKRRLRLTKNAQVIRHKVDIEFLRVDPEMLRLVAGVELVYKHEGRKPSQFGGTPFGVGPFGGESLTGFGEVPFGVALFGGEAGSVIGFDSGTTLRATSFALEVWSKLDNASAKPNNILGFNEGGFDEGPFGIGWPAPTTSQGPQGWDEVAWDEGPWEGGWRPEYTNCSARRWGYTLFPFLRGGRLSGFKFEDGLVSFNLAGAQTRRNPGWGVGPFDLTGPFERLDTPVSRNTSWRMFITNAAPPAEQCGIQYLDADVLDNGTAINPMPEPSLLVSVDGGTASTEPDIIDGGRA